MCERYKVLRKIADGGMAEIFLGLQAGAAGFERPVVLKRLRAALAQAPEHRKALAEEARAAMGLGHSNIVQVLDVGTSAGLEYLVLELVRGWDLHCLLKRAQAAAEPLPPSLSVYIASEICRALAYAHARADGERPFGVVHCDVNPHNILVSQEGEVKLTDFGIAVAGGAKPSAASACIKGKAGFMSPEQAAGNPLDARSDLFSLGTTLYAMATGRRPFQGASELATLALNRKGRATPPARICADLPAELDAVICKAMQRSPDKRFPSAEAMLAALERVLRKSPEPAGQTELKRWLMGLSRKDGALPISGADGLEGGEGAPAARPPPIPADALAPSPSADERPMASRAGRRGAAVALALLASGAGGWRLGAAPSMRCGDSPLAQARAAACRAGALEVDAISAVNGGMAASFTVPTGRSTL